MAHMPPCRQQLQAQADRQGADAPFTSTDVWKGIQRLNANKSVQQQLLITILLV